MEAQQHILYQFEMDKFVKLMEGYSKDVIDFLQYNKTKNKTASNRISRNDYKLDKNIILENKSILQKMFPTLTSEQLTDICEMKVCYQLSYVTKKQIENWKKQVMNSKPKPVLTQSQKSKIKTQWIEKDKYYTQQIFQEKKRNCEGSQFVKDAKPFTVKDESTDIIKLTTSIDDIAHLKISCISQETAEDSKLGKDD